MMKPRFVFILTQIVLCLLPYISQAQDTPIRLDFSGDSAEANQVTLMGAGFGQYPQANVTFGPIPTDNAFPSATIKSLTTRNSLPT